MRHRRKISPEKVLEAVKKDFNDEGSKTTIAEEYGISFSFFRACIARYREQGELAFIEIPRNKVYSEETRKHAIEAYLNGEGSFIDIAAKYGLRTKSTLQKWVKVYNSGKGFRHNMSGGSRMKEARSTTEKERIQIAKDCISNI